MKSNPIPSQREGGCKDMGTRCENVTKDDYVPFDAVVENSIVDCKYSKNINIPSSLLVLEM